MGRKEGVRIVAIVEDQRLERFVRKTLEEFGVDSHKLRIRPDYPKGGHGSGKQFVEKKYREEIVTYRRNADENCALVLATDADEQTVAQRRARLDEQVAAIAQRPRETAEAIVYWIPKWHVETWGLHLTGNRVDENTNYKSEGKDIRWDDAADRFRQEYLESKKPAMTTIPSLEQAYVETRRLRF